MFFGTFELIIIAMILFFIVLMVLFARSIYKKIDS
jgi:hypothetical protein